MEFEPQLSREPQKLSRGKVVDFVIQHIRDGILEGRFAPGQRLISSELMTDINVSRGSLREAFSCLTAEGLLDLVPNRGAIVRRLTRAEMVNLFRIREVLEGLAARQAAEAIHRDDNLARFDAMWKFAKPDGSSISSEEFTKKNSLFHSTLVAIANNPQLADLLNRLHIRVIMFQFGRALRQDDVMLSHQEHVPIAEAVRAGDPDAADAAMRRHLRGSCERIQQITGSLLKPERLTSKATPGPSGGYRPHATLSRQSERRKK